MLSAGNNGKFMERTGSLDGITDLQGQCLCVGEVFEDEGFTVAMGRIERDLALALDALIPC
jgi:hypothetical protein